MRAACPAPKSHTRGNSRSVFVSVCGWCGLIWSAVQERSVPLQGNAVTQARRSVPRLLYAPIFATCVRGRVSVIDLAVHHPVVLAKAGTHKPGTRADSLWVPAFARTTRKGHCRINWLCPHSIERRLLRPMQDMRRIERIEYRIFIVLENTDNAFRPDAKQCIQRRQAIDELFFRKIRMFVQVIRDILIN